MATINIDWPNGVGKIKYYAWKKYIVSKMAVETYELVSNGSRYVQ